MLILSAGIPIAFEQVYHTPTYIAHERVSTVNKRDLEDTWCIVR